MPFFSIACIFIDSRWLGHHRIRNPNRGWTRWSPNSDDLGKSYTSFSFFSIPSLVLQFSRKNWIKNEWIILIHKNRCHSYASFFLQIPSQKSDIVFFKLLQTKREETMRMQTTFLNSSKRFNFYCSQKIDFCVKMSKINFNFYIKPKKTGWKNALEILHTNDG